MLISGNLAEGDRIIGGRFQFSTRKQMGRVAIMNQPKQQGPIIGFGTLAGMGRLGGKTDSVGRQYQRQIVPDDPAAANPERMVEKETESHGRL